MINNINIDNNRYYEYDLYQKYYVIDIINIIIIILKIIAFVNDVTYIILILSGISTSAGGQLSQHLTLSLQLTAWT